MQAVKIEVALCIRFRLKKRPLSRPPIIEIRVHYRPSDRPAVPASYGPSHRATVGWTCPFAPRPIGDNHWFVFPEVVARREVAIVGEERGELNAPESIMPKPLATEVGAKGQRQQRGYACKPISRRDLLHHRQCEQKTNSQADGYEARTRRDSRC
jgi:hypothetical protein